MFSLEIRLFCRDLFAVFCLFAEEIRPGPRREVSLAMSAGG